MKKSIRDRIRITRTGKVIRRAMGLGLSRAKRSAGNRHRKLANRSLFGSETRNIMRKTAQPNLI